MEKIMEKNNGERKWWNQNIRLMLKWMRVGNTWRVHGERRTNIIQENYSLRNRKNESETKKILRLDHQLTINEEITHTLIFPISPFEVEVHLWNGETGLRVDRAMHIFRWQQYRHQCWNDRIILRSIGLDGFLLVKKHDIEPSALKWRNGEKSGEGRVGAHTWLEQDRDKSLRRRGASPDCRVYANAPPRRPFSKCE